MQSVTSNLEQSFVQQQESLSKEHEEEKTGLNDELQKLSSLVHHYEVLFDTVKEGASGQKSQPVPVEGASGSRPQQGNIGSRQGSKGVLTNSAKMMNAKSSSSKDDPNAISPASRKVVALKRSQSGISAGSASGSPSGAGRRADALKRSSTGISLGGETDRSRGATSRDGSIPLRQKLAQIKAGLQKDLVQIEIQNNMDGGENPPADEPLTCENLSKYCPRG